MKLAKKVITIVLFLAAITSNLFANEGWTNNGTITGVWMMPNVDKVIFTMSNTGTTLKLWIDYSDKETLAFVLNAFNNKDYVDIMWNDIETYSPWAGYVTFKPVFVRTSGLW